MSRLDVLDEMISTSEMLAFWSISWLHRSKTRDSLHPVSRVWSASRSSAFVCLQQTATFKAVIGSLRFSLLRPGLDCCGASDQNGCHCSCSSFDPKRIEFEWSVYSVDLTQLLSLRGLEKSCEREPAHFYSIWNPKVSIKLHSAVA